MLVGKEYTFGDHISYNRLNMFLHSTFNLVGDVVHQKLMVEFDGCFLPLGNLRFLGHRLLDRNGLELTNRE